MAEVTGIAWTRSTFNPWVGCTKVGPGCDHCYAEQLDKRHRWKGATHWGVGVPRMRTGEANWNKVLGWNRKALEEQRTGVVPVNIATGLPEWSGKPGFWPVFCASLADVFDNEVPAEWRRDLWELIGKTPALTWLLLTKRIGLAARMLPYEMLPNVWLGATIVNAEEAARDVPKLLATPAAVRFVSYEPALGPVDWTAYPGIDWIIVGGESTQGAQARDFDIEWAYNTITQAVDIGAAPFVKQLGSRQGLKDRAGANPSDWPLDLQVQEFPRDAGNRRREETMTRSAPLNGADNG